MAKSGNGPEGDPSPDSDDKVGPFTRRDFLARAGKGAAALTIGGMAIPAIGGAPEGFVPLAEAGRLDTFSIDGKEGLVYLNDRPVNAETPPHLLNDNFTPGRHMFIRNNGLPPKKVNPATWTLTIDGEVEKEMVFTIDELKKKFTNHTLALTIECGGNGRAFFYPAAKGNQWTFGAVSCGLWTGVKLADVLTHCGVKESAVFVAYYGADTHLSGDPAKAPISRGAPIAKAMEPETLIAWSLDGGDIPHQNGHPLRLVAAGWPGSVSGKWLTRLWVRDQVHDGPKMTGQAYRVPCQPVAPGDKVADENMCVIESMPVKSLITSPKSGARHKVSEPFKLHGHAWKGDGFALRMEVSIDFGVSWQRVRLRRQKNKQAWQNFDATIDFPKPGYYEVWARATDNDDKKQPVVVPGWNPKGYLNNACHRIAVYVEE